jgi:hypothetical protein
MIKILSILALVVSCQVSAFIPFYSGSSVVQFTTTRLGKATSRIHSGIIQKPMEDGDSMDHIMILMAERKRRKRKNATSYSSSSSSSISKNVNSQELPEFDLVEEEDSTIATTTTSSKPSSDKSTATNKNKASFDINDPKVQNAMKATNTRNTNAQQSLMSTTDLIRTRNRELEEKLVTNDIIENVPSLAEYTQNRKVSKGNGMTTSSSSSIGKKAARREERISAALEAKKMQDGIENEGGFLNGFSFGKDKDGNPKTPIKLLEEGTWACIWILIAWEVYINSPLFERQGSMPPIVFQEVSELFLM